jgi:hypothetical protein
LTSTKSAAWKRPPGLSTRATSAKADALQVARLSTPLEMMRSAQPDSTGRSSARPSTNFEVAEVALG